MVDEKWTSSRDTYVNSIILVNIWGGIYNYGKMRFDRDMAKCSKKEIEKSKWMI